jgi:GTPase SAR1 family protein
MTGRGLYFCLLIAFTTYGRMTSAMMSADVLGLQNSLLFFFLRSTDVRAQFWDSLGQERFRSLTSSFFRDADVLLLGFDLVTGDSFFSVKRYYDDAMLYNEDTRPEVLVLGMRADLARQESKRVVRHRPPPLLILSAPADARRCRAQAARSSRRSCADATWKSRPWTGRA